MHELTAAAATRRRSCSTLMTVSLPLSRFSIALSHPLSIVGFGHACVPPRSSHLSSNSAQGFGLVRRQVQLEVAHSRPCMAAVRILAQIASSSGHPLPLCAGRGRCPSLANTVDRGHRDCLPAESRAPACGSRRAQAPRCPRLRPDLAPHAPRGIGAAVLVCRRRRPPRRPVAGHPRGVARPAAAPGVRRP